MAGAGSAVEDPMAASMTGGATTVTTSSVEEWVVEYARFFNFPPAPSTPPPGLRLLSKGKKRSNGTWLPAASPAMLILVRPHALSLPVLSVSLFGVIHEEHFVCNLNFSWPQVSCVTQCPIRGSRVVFMSYKECSRQGLIAEPPNGWKMMKLIFEKITRSLRKLFFPQRIARKIQKFAVRFPMSCDAEAFLEIVKECSRDTMDIGLPGSDYVCENSSPSEIIASNRLQYRIDEDSILEEPVATYPPELPALIFNEEQAVHPLQTQVATNTESIFSGLPPSFIELLATCSADTKKEPPRPMEEVAHASQNGGNELDPSIDAVASSGEQPEFMDEADLKTQIVKYMSDASFHEMLYKIEKVINELGGDMSL